MIWLHSMSTHDVAHRFAISCGVVNLLDEYSSRAQKQVQASKTGGSSVSMHGAHAHTLMLRRCIYMMTACARLSWPRHIIRQSAAAASSREAAAQHAIHI